MKVLLMMLHRLRFMVRKGGAPSRGLLTLVCYLGLSTLTWAAGISVDLDPAQISLGEQVRLTLTYDPNAAQGTPDVSALQADFTILATEQSMSYSMINGQARSIGQWSLVLEPKHAGLITIPALHIGTLSTAPIQLNVSTNGGSSSTPSQTTQQTPQDDRSLPSTLLTVEVDNKTPYLHQQVVYKVHLETRDRLVDVRYQAPQVDDAILFPLGTGQSYQTTHAGLTYHVDEQLYAIFPQKSGSLLITPPALHALSYDLSPKPIRLTAKPIALQVQSLPKDAVRRTWLPSKLVRLQEHYDQADTQLKQGATVVRTIELQAQGLVAQLLPDLSFPELADLRTYPEPVKRDTRIQQGELWGRTKVKVTYVFAKAGTIQLPAIRVPWFNVNTKKMEIAELPAKSYEILATTPEHAAKPTKPKVAKTKHPTLRTTYPQPSLFTFHSLQPQIWIGTTIGVLACGLVGILAVWRRRRVKPYRDLRMACKANDPHRAKSALLAWSQQQWPDKNLTHYTELRPVLREHAALYSAVQTLTAVLYRPETHLTWEGAPLWHAIQAFKRQPRTKRTRKQTVPTIHPTRK